MCTATFRSRTILSLAFSIAITLVVVFATETRNAAQSAGLQAPSQGPGGDATLMETCVGSSNTLRDMSGFGGRARFVGSVKGQPIRSPLAVAGMSPEGAARAYLAACGSLFGLGDQATELTLRSQRQVDANRSVVRFQQTHAGIPVLGGELVAQVDAGGNIITVSGELLPDAPEATAPTVSPFDAREKALEAVAKEHGRDASQLVASESKLWVYAPSLIGPGAGPSRLVWRFEVTAGDLVPIRQLVLIDATRGSVALSFNQTETARNRLTYTANNGTTLPGSLVCNEANDLCAGGDADAVGAHRGARDAYDFYALFHGRDSINGGGLTLTSTVHFDVNYVNAFWNGQQMVYGDGCGFARADDVVGHELTHAVTQYESGLFYYYQSGAINESLSDLWGEFIDQWNARGNDADGVRWQMGEDVTGGTGCGAIRNMQNPPAFGDPDRMRSANYWLSDLDGGGVHINSGVNNKAVWLMTDGGTFNGQTVSALGLTKVAKIYYEVQTNLLTSGSDYNDLYNLLYQGCLNLVGTSGITVGDCVEAREATLAVEMNLEPIPGFHPEAPVCSAGVPTNVFFDNMEGGPGNWNFTVAAGSGTRWQHDGFGGGPYAHSGLHYLYGDDFPPGVTDALATMNSAAIIPANAFLHFDHVYEFETGYDGGVVEYTTNNGASWNDAGALFDYNGYSSTLFAGSPIGGRSAFTGSSHGYRSARLNLSSLAGQSVRFRWRMGLDSSVAVGGWFLDDVRVYTCGAPPPSAQVSSLYPVSGAQPGRTVALSAWVANTGISALPAGSEVFFYVTGPSFTSWVGSASVAGLAPGAGQWYSYNWAIPSGIQTGSYQLSAQVWRGSQTLSTVFGPQGFTVSSPVVVSGLYPVSGAQPGRTVPLSAWLTNTSPSTLPAGSNVAFYVTGPSFASWVGSVSVAGLAPGAAQWYSFNWTIPSNVQTGNYQFSGQAWLGTQALSSGFGPQAFTISALVDIQSLWPVSGAARNATVSLPAYVVNASSIPLAADARVYFWVTGPSFSSWVGSTSVAGLAPGAGAWYTFNWTIPSNQPLGSYGFYAQVWGSQPLSATRGPQPFSILSFQLDASKNALSSRR